MVAYFYKSDGEDVHPHGQSGQAIPPPHGDGTRLEAILHRRDSTSGMFVKLRPTDRQLKLPFIGELN